MKLTIFSRKAKTKGATKAMRREGNIPAILYSKGQVGEVIGIKGVEFSAMMRDLKSGHLSTSVFLLNDGSGERRAIIKEIQYHPTTYRPVHIDFEELFNDMTIRVKVPIFCTGVAECIGVKSGGFLRQVIHHVKVECRAQNMPKEFIVDLKDLGINQSKRLKDLELPEGVKLLASEEEVIAVIGKR